MTLRKQIFFALAMACQCLMAQNDTIALQKVVVSDFYLKKNNTSQNLLAFSDSIINKNKPSLTNLLNNNSSIYFKENGFGMVSSPAFRGTTAQQTAVVWNGININSQLNGQTDFNTISTRNFDNITIKAGGGSTLYGSGAIGGTIHLNNELVFKNQNLTEFQQEFGSFSTFNSHLNSKIGNSKVVFHLGFSQNRSQNDFDYVGIFDWKGNQRKNINGSYENTSWNGAFGYKINSKNTLKLFSQTYSDLRYFSLINPSDTKTKYRNINYRNLVEFTNNHNRFTTNIKLASLSENYLYYQNIENQGFSFGKVNSFISRFDLGYQLSKSIQVNSIAEYNHAKGFGSNITSSVREISVFSLVFHQKIKNLTNDLSFRQEITNAYRSPLVFSFGSALELNSYFVLKANFSKNFRAPTFNDLYYVGSGGIGNSNLKSENALQGEIGAVFKHKKITFTQTAYFIHTKDLISWFPINSNVWSPINTKRVHSYGLESALNWNFNWQKQYFSLNGTYAYTIADNLETKTQLAYVPFHKLTTSLGYNYADFSFAYQFLYNGFVYTLLDNKPNQIVAVFYTSNITLDYKIKKLKSIKIGVQFANLFNETYQSIDGRYMPGRNFTLFTNFKF